MVNALMHRVETLESETVETVKALQDALGAVQGAGRDDRYLDDTYTVDLLCETLSDGSEAFSVRIRKTPRQT